MKYICIEGCIGVGKTTIATQLANSLNGVHLLLEDFGAHPFLEDFYADSKYTFETELGFLLIHYHQLLKAMNEQSQVLISDYFFGKDKLFADANILSEKETTIFMQLYDYLLSSLVKPDIIICLSGTTDMIYNRVLARNRESEKNISYDYIDKINKNYEIFFSEIRKKYSIIDINMNEKDFVKNPGLITELQQNLIKKNVL
jgi:deoxyadenosine/deoxycytidine kinase